MKKDDFISILKRNSPKEINEYIENKGKKRKSVLPYDIVDKDLYEKNFLGIKKGE